MDMVTHISQQQRRHRPNVYSESERTMTESVPSRGRKRRRGKILSSSLFFLTLLVLVVVLLAVTPQIRAFASSEGVEEGWKKLESDTIDSRRRSTKTQRATNDDKSRLLRISPRELARDVYTKRRSRTNEMKKATIGRRRLVFQRDVVAIPSGKDDDDGSFAKKKEELFFIKTKKTKASEGGEKERVVQQTITEEEDRNKEEEELTVSRERLLRRGRRTAAPSAAAAQNVE